MTVKGNQRIACSVDACAHNAQGQGCCMLDSINVCCSRSKATDASGSMCASFRAHTPKNTTGI